MHKIKSSPLLIKHHRAEKATDINHIASHTRYIEPGGCFYVKKSPQWVNHAQLAIERGIQALITDDHALFEQLKQLDDNQAAIFLFRNNGDLLWQLCQLVYGALDPNLKLIAVTGTNGKTTTTHLVQQMLRHLGQKAGLIGSLGLGYHEKLIASGLTTPPIDVIYGYIHALEQQKISYGILEATSIGLEQQRLGKLLFKIAGFTNLSHDHLDYHHTMESYFSAKKILFNQHLDGLAVINHDDHYGRQLSESLIDKPHLSYSLQSDSEADLRLNLTEQHQNQTQGLLLYKQQKYNFCSQLVGRYNMLNSLCALGIMLGCGAMLDEALNALRHCAGAKGRFQLIEKHCRVIIDYAHTPDALAKVLEAAKETSSGRLIVVFGCGGDRDRDKRPLMGAVAARWSDVVYITNDNPRGEDPQSIADDILSGMTNLKPKTELDRRQAITQALRMAEPQDTVLIAGKGHESTQTIGQDCLPFSDEDEVLRFA